MAAQILPINVQYLILAIVVFVAWHSLALFVAIKQKRAIVEEVRGFSISEFPEQLLDIVIMFVVLLIEGAFIYVLVTCIQRALV